MLLVEQDNRSLRSTAEHAASGTLGVLIPDGIGVRNFVLGPFLQQAARRWQLHVFHAIPEDPLDVLTETANGTNARDGGVHWHRLQTYRDRPTVLLLRESLSYAHMNRMKSPANRRGRRWPTRGPWRSRSARQVAWLIGRASTVPPMIPILDRLHTWAAGRLPSVDHYRQVFRDIRPKALFCSHQRPAEIVPPVVAARSLGIPTATFIFSWDNITRKGRIAAPFDHFLVWSDHMRQELLQYYPNVAEQQVHVVGTPQFDPYADDSLLWTRGDFCQRLGADPSRPLICYSGGAAGTVAEDPQYVRLLLDLIRTGAIRGQPQVLLRPCPVDEGHRYDELGRDYPDLLYCQPRWMHAANGSWSAVIPSMDDVQFLANLTYHAELNINFASTMTLDFAIRDKPIVNVAFDTTDPPRGGVRMWDFYQELLHYRPVMALGAARLARSPDELAEHVNAYIDDPTVDREGRAQFVAQQIGTPLGQASNRILEVLRFVSKGEGEAPAEPKRL